MTNSRYYSVLVDLPIEVGDCFTYCSTETLSIGERVEVELGRRSTIGYVVGDADPIDQARTITQSLDPFPLLTPELIALARQMSLHYFSSWYRCVSAILPATLKRNRPSRGRTKITLSCNVRPDNVSTEIRADERILSALMFLAEHPDSVTVAELSRKFDLSRSRIDTLVRKKILGKKTGTETRNPFVGTEHSSAPDKPLSLNPEQNEALSAIIDEKKNAVGGKPREVLISGVTGSGKTEVYLQAISLVLNEGKSAIVLVPEISLTPQTVDRFRSRFGDTVAILHSHLSAGERHDEWLRLRNGTARVAVGARSAVFAPVENLGLIVIDEAHEASYKQSDSPRYNAIEIARMRVAMTRDNALVVLGTATPSCEMLARADRAVRLHNRVASREMPGITVVDMRKEMANGNRSIFSIELRAALKKTLADKEQALLFLNRRGHASFILCRACGHTISCPRCAVSLTLHHSSARVTGAPMLVCHFCNHRSAQPNSCPKCSSAAIRAFGAGTQRIEQEIKKSFPHARTVRMDADTTVKKGEHRRILGEFASGKYDVLIGTQMIGKGLDLPRITLVGIVAADSSLHLPDFRAPERTFQILVQVAGRAGRADRKGRAIIQTYVPEHYAIRNAANYDIDRFALIEKKVRKTAALPPFTRILQWTFESSDPRIVRNVAVRAAAAMEGFPGTILGPAPAPIEFLRGRTRWQMRWLFDPSTLQNVLTSAVGRIRSLKQKDLRIVVDVDPIDMM